MKKHLLALVVLMVVMTGTSGFGQGLGFSAGAGLVVAPEWGKIEFSGGGTSFAIADNFQSPLGVQAFFDATYVQLRVGYLFGGERAFEPFTFEDSGTPVTINLSGKYDYTVLDFSVLGKYPFQIGSIRISPVAGIGYTLFTKLILPNEATVYAGKSFFDLLDDTLDIVDEEDKAAARGQLVSQYQASNRFWISTGLDAEIPLVGNIFLQPSVLAQFGLASRDERNFKDLFLEEVSGGSASQSNFRLQTSLSVGYRF